MRKFFLAALLILTVCVVGCAQQKNSSDANQIPTEVATPEAQPEEQSAPQAQPDKGGDSSES